MRILCGLISFLGLAAFCGCGTPEAEFAWSESTEELLPPAKSAVKTYVQDRFGTPAKMVAWQRLPIDFGGIPGVITDVTRSEDYQNIITGLTVDFRVPAMLAKYDENLDGLLAFSEFPAELQQAITIEKFEGADSDKDGLLSAVEIGKIRRVDSELFITETISPVSKEAAQELMGKEVLFVEGRFKDQSTKVQSINAENGLVEIWPPLNDEVAEEESAIELSGTQVMLDFGRNMRSGRHLYMRHCMHCHGVTGDGNGPTAEYLSPLPRDYRKGIFKFVSTPRETVKHPSRDDLARILKNGIPGTYMPSFAMLKDQEVIDIIEYVRWLSMRGEYEDRLNVLLKEEYSNEAVANEIASQVDTYKRNVEDGKVSNDAPAVTGASVRAEIDKKLESYLQETLAQDIDEEANLFTEQWRAAELQANVITPKVSKPHASPDSIARGRFLYLGKCAVCHGVTAEGNGENTRGYQKDPAGNEYPVPGFFDDWGHPIQPRNLNTGIYRGGRRPLDIYRRIHEGIPGTPMQSFAAAFTDEQIWDLVDYVMSIPVDGPIPAQAAGASKLAKAAQPKSEKLAQSKATAKVDTE